MSKEYIELCGYHATDYVNYSDIIKGGFKNKKRNDHWLGQGTYFFDNIELAKWWGSKNNDYCIIRALIKVEDSLFLDLDTIKGMNSFLKDVNEIFKNAKIKLHLDTEKPFKNLCLALDVLKQKKGIKVVAYTFVKESPRYATESVREFKENNFSLPYCFGYKERQICATDDTVIFNKEFIHREVKKRWS